MRKIEEKENYIAHKNKENGKIQTIKEHSENTARLCMEMSIPELKEINRIIGLLHDIGKYQNSFQRRMKDEKIRVEHSICGAQIAKKIYEKPFLALAYLMEYCIAGHHSGIPDGGVQNGRPDSLNTRLQREMEDYSAYQEELEIPQIDLQKVINFFAQDIKNDIDFLIDKFAFLTRYCFSCLVDADSEDTARFCGDGTLPEDLKTNFQSCLEKVNRKLQSFQAETELQKARALLQKQVFDKTGEKAEIYLMNMPTGSGKTLCSVKFALEKAIAEKKKRIIYVIPFLSVADQTVGMFENLFGKDAQILRHQSTFSYDDAEDFSEDYRISAKHATENWSADFIVTTMVQFLGSLYSNRRGKLRKVHNMADAVLIFDEAHLMPVEYLQPCLQGIAFLTRYLNSSAVFLTATMPDFPSLIQTCALENSKIVNLVTDTSDFEKFKKCKFSYIGKMEQETLLSKSRQSASSLIVVNKKRTARELYRQCTGKKYHLSTYLAAYDRKRILDEIRKELKQLEDDYPDLEGVPEERHITVISTSLIEAGVDLDMAVVFRQLTGLDSILQAGGRCNREGKRQGATTFVFELSEDQKEDEGMNKTRGLLKKYADVSSQECIREYYNCMYKLRETEIEEHAIHNDYKDIRQIGFKTYAEKFHLIESNTQSIVVGCNEEAKRRIEELQKTQIGNPRKFQNYACSVTQAELDDLVRQHAVKDYGTGIFCLISDGYYDENLGILFEGKDYII